MSLKNLRQVIIKKYGSAAEFSMHVPEDETAISRIINGRRSLSIERQKLWARKLGCQHSKLFPKQKRR